MVSQYVWQGQSRSGAKLVTGLYRLICYINSTKDETVFQHWQLGLFQDASFGGDWNDSNSASRGMLYIFGTRTFVPLSWKCKKEPPYLTAVSSLRSCRFMLEKMDGWFDWRRNIRNAFLKLRRILPLEATLRIGDVKMRVLDVDHDPTNILDNCNQIVHLKDNAAVIQTIHKDEDQI